MESFVLLFEQELPQTLEGFIQESSCAVEFIGG